jgi:hypothetical protein
MKQYLVMGVVALAAIWVANNIAFVGNIVNKRA